MKILTLAWVIIFQVVFLTNADARGSGRGGSGKSYSSVSHSSYSSKGKSRSSSSRSSSGYASGSSDSCPCSGSNDCIGPRGGIYCYTSGGNKRYR
ncbi:hypothetical protein [Acinetobacter soli]|uniref:Uncharacterized protein n=1 Tax=Acinetobacter soli TaxID=487316 RepID=A0AB38YTS2_9GAMM|nr:hypothetical protein [Acinetobacter soli]WND04740.1 hypothetical protein RHP80_11000 [Acinetobacter soli]